MSKMMGLLGGTKKPHAVLIPFPSQGHINPFLKLAKLLHSNGFHITFVNTDFNHQRLVKSRGPNALIGFPNFQFETIPDGLPPSNMDSTQSIPALCDSTRKHCLIPFCNLISKLNHSHAPPVTCIFSDGVMSFTIKASQQFGLPNILFWTHSACAFMSFKECKNLMERGLIPLKDANYLTNGHLDSAIDWIPGLKNITLRDLPGIYRTTDPNDILLDFLVEQIEATSKASAIILPTFDALEHDVLNALSTMFPKLYTIGPLELLLVQTSESTFDSIKCNLWKEESECLKWLDSQEPNSVLYVNFGSVIVMRHQQLVELAWGLANSKKKFMWVIRPDLVEGEASILPPEIVEETKDRGLLVGWCPQEQVLKHPAVAGFLTHCGWNSTLESITNGVPLICCPFFNDQTLNCRYISREWAFGMEMDSDNVTRAEVEKLVKELLEGEKGKEMKKKAIEWKKLAQEATHTNGSSFLNLEKLVNELLFVKS
ncbi:hypothetical protein JHK82_041437 [Glycine max]|uniref:Glycosyltransferase n=2 Tax=Glycine subgen. Soja TaxID=1462606 RepID=I1MDU8_SOYBN|nr:7-deoxyloganetin glucosyltransferase [Glycine max]XP_028203466.1 7-deoxyloganetin glucosyltransferase-like [Glycine soja]KAG4945381.1 hypothetical protein JHK87_041388 [Glycine soja]KAG4948255.1 hypothetical protein JHK86_041494 [Glycine max]KAG4955722.1 hypothetical protein JHK85_042102 [Glycine max]KAG5104467.1 hypothetical protein JHK82_041437 [Glycine max]KAG5115590.1 hypothetical protein JHK84_041703 [Glycine max]|eukprot:XP_003547073.1 7-deoxyloganetin glucosyltransferase [Glycine max]